MIKTTAVIDLGYGDSGKGTTVEWLCDKLKPDFVGRFNGAAQAAHNIHLECGHSHTFSQFGCGTFQGVKTYLSRYVSIEPLGIYMEAQALNKFIGNEVLNGLYIHKDAMVITPYHRALNRFKETRRGADRHGSTGFGHGALMKMSIKSPSLTLRYKDLVNKKTILARLDAIRADILKEFSGIENHEDFNVDLDGVVDMYGYIYDNTITVDNEMERNILSSNVVWEGAQGILLDENFGFHPHTTWSTVNQKNIISMYNHHDLDYELNVIGVIRSHMTRHGAGVFVTEDDECNHMIADDDNCFNEWQEDFRAGHLDMMMLKYALKVCPIKSFVMTHFDKLDSLGTMKVCKSYNVPNYKTVGDELVGIYPPFNLYQQIEITEILKLATPNYVEMPVIDLIEYITSEIGVECAMLSLGKTLKNKLTF